MGYIRRMRLYAWLLGILAVFGSLLLGGNWLYMHHGLALSEKAEASFAKAQQDGESAVALERQHDDFELENTRVQMRNDTLSLESDELSGKNTPVDRARIRADQMYINAFESSHQVQELLGPDSRIAEPKERLTAAHAAAIVYAKCETRDEHLAYALGVLWLAFGFAASLATRPARS